MRWRVGDISHIAEQVRQALHNQRVASCLQQFKAAEEQRIKYETILKSITDKAKEDLYSTHQKKTDNSFWS